MQRHEERQVVTDRRRHRRFKVKEGALAFLGSTPGTIVDISEAGMTVHYVVFEHEPARSFSLDIYFSGDDFFLENIPSRLVSDINSLIEAPLSSIRVKRLGIQFGELSDLQKSRLKYFILHNTSIAI